MIESSVSKRDNQQGALAQGDNPADCLIHCHVVELVSEALNKVGKTAKASKKAVLGVAYKPDIKDVQLSPLERVCISLKELGSAVDIYGPMFAGEQVFGFPVKRSLAQAVKGADCVVIGGDGRRLCVQGSGAQVRDARPRISLRRSLLAFELKK